MASDTFVLSENDVPGAKLKSDPIHCSVDELKRWLYCHGIKRTGKKDELVERVRLSVGILRHLRDKGFS